MNAAMLVQWTLVLAVLSVSTSAATVGSASGRACYEPGKDFYPYMSTKSAYELVHGDIVRPAAPTCAPVQVWMLARHGTRYPGEKLIPGLLNLTSARDQILRNHQLGRGELCPKDLERLGAWLPDANMTLETADTLVPQGRVEHYELAKRLRDAFPQLLEAREPEDYVFRATDTQRTRASLRAFADGLLGGRSELVTPEVQPKLNDTLLLAHKNCAAWTAGFALGQVSAQRDEFAAGSEVADLLKRTSRRLGFSDTMSLASANSIYDMCRFETAWQPELASPWCALLAREDLRVLEYLQDLDYYYCCGPGRRMSAKLGCQTLSDVYRRFENLATQNATEPRGVFYFAHTLTLQALVSALGTFDDERPLLARDYARDRRYRTSLYGPFATNVLAVFYRCNGTTSESKVMFHVAERPVKIPGCQDLLCSWDELRRQFAAAVDGCSLDFCNEPRTDGGASATFDAAAVLAMTIALNLALIVAR